MLDQLTPLEIEIRAKRAGITMKEVCARASVSTSTFSRWKNRKQSPTLAVFIRLYEASAPPTPERTAND